MANTKGTSVINNPQGGGAQSGLGEKFSPDLFTGTGNFSVPIAVPAGRNGFQPELTLGYSSGNGNGAFGMGWALGIPGVTRKTSKGIPVYDDRSDIFILSGAEDLVPISIINVVTSGVGHEQTTYRPRTEGLYARIIRHKKTTGEHYWEVSSKDGLISWYGTADAATDDPAVIADPLNRSAIFAWHLTKTKDPFGNVIIYSYERDLVIPPASGAGSTNPHTYDQLYVSKIEYAQYLNIDGDTHYLCEVDFVYEDRPDPFSAYKQGFETRMVKRCNSIELYTNAVSRLLTKIYHFNYKTALPLNGASLLASVSVEGIDGDQSESMPPLEFGYSVFDPTKRSLEALTGPLPIVALSDPGYELVDLDGNGLPDLLQLNGTARYWTNKGNGRFSAPRSMNIAPSVQLGMPGVQMIDANGDGRTDLLVNNGTQAGYFPGAFHSVWDSNSYRPYKNIPSFSFSDPEVQLIDLDGDGVTDVLRNGSRFECFYNDPDKGFYKVGTAPKEFANFSFADPRIRFADMTGDGLTDIVLVSSGRVQYWPNMGYGRFGKKVTMKNAPRFPEQFNPKQVLLGDLDGDGQADIAFVDNNTVTLYVNQSGNGFSDGTSIPNTPRVENVNALRIVDIMGTGLAGILWTYNAGSGSGNVFFLDLTKGNKPYVMQSMDNHMGSLTQVSYGSSVYHYLRDEAQPETRWKTDLPFPVQVVNKVEVFDFLSGGKLVTEYNYHNGYWDGVEREFRGFAHVDSTDTESFTSYTVPNPNVVDGLPSTSADLQPAHYSPPTMTKSWFYVGPVGDGFSRWHEPDFSDEYWSGDVPVFQRPQDLLTLLASLPRPAQRDALRTLRGSLLRSELYALDKSALQDIPYTVTESRMSLRNDFDPSQLADSPVSTLLKKSYNKQSGSGYVFFPFNIAQRTTQYERGTDPMHNFSFTKDYDLYGQALGQLSVGVPRGISPAAAMGHYAGPFNGAPGNYLTTYSLSDYIIKDDPGGQYMVNRVKRSRSWDASQSSVGKDIFSLRDTVFSDFETYPVLSCVLNYYDGSAFVGLGYGLLGDFGAQVRSEALMITEDMVTDIYGSNIPPCFNGGSWSGYPTDFINTLQNADDQLGYTYQTGGNYETGWYAESTRLQYDFQVGDGVGLVLESKDVFENTSSIEYDDYNLLPVKSRQWLDGSGTSYLETTAYYDYRVMQPYQVKDVNDNYSEFDFSPLGLLRATALIGKGTEGDYKSASGNFYDKYEPSVRMEYDFFSFFNNSEPVFVRTISRELHYQQSPASNTIVKVEYSDGFGRLLQTRVQAEDVIFGASTGAGTYLGDSGLPISLGTNANAIGTQRSGGDPLNVVVSGWKIYNNKGKVVEQYEPFFDKGFDYVLPDLLGVKVKMYYDPLGRVVKTVNPDNSQQWVIYGIPIDLTQPPDPITLTGRAGCITTPWVNFAYDANDLAPITNPVNNVPSTHYYTPKSSETDALGRTISTTEYVSQLLVSGDNIDMQYQYDVRGNLMFVTDPLGRTVFSHKYDLRAPQKDHPLPPLYTKHIDKGESTIVVDALGKPIQSDDAKGARVLSAYEVLQRPTYGWANDNTGESITLRQFLEYGDSLTGTPEDHNLKGKPYWQYDEAGRINFIAYDFKGNILDKTREVISDAELLSVVSTTSVVCYRVDWTGIIGPTPSILDLINVYETLLDYDALNRITKMTYPEDQDVNHVKAIVPTYNNAGALVQLDLSDTNISVTPHTTVITNYVQHIAYNAKGQRILISYGNGIMTRYAYDSLTFRLIRQRSESYLQSGWTYSPNGNKKQDTAYAYDLIGNIIASTDNTTCCGVGGSNLLGRDFEYDPIYRLLSANGRENQPLTVDPWDNSYRSDDNSLTTAYTQNYTYDKLGNITQLQHTGNTSFTRSFNYPTTTNKLSSIDVGAKNYAFTYDRCGNQLTETTSRHWEWDHSDRPRSFYVGTTGSITQYTQYLYDLSGQRVKKLSWKSTGDYTSNSYIDGVFEYLTDGTDNQNSLHVMDNQSRIATLRVGASFGNSKPAILFNIENNIGSSTVQLDNTGANVNYEEYFPFGETSFGSYAKKRYRYVGKERDGESGLHYYGARYYAAWTCRFISVDPLAGKYNWQSSYVHADNNPVTKVDHNGEGTGDGGGEPKSGGDGNKNAASQNSGGTSAASKKIEEKVTVLFFDKSSADKDGNAIKQAYDLASKETEKNTNLKIYKVDNFGQAANILEELDKTYDIKTVGFVAHGAYNPEGNEPSMTLGGETINKSNISNYKSDLNRINKVLDKGDNLVLFTCHTGQINSKGDNAFLGKMAKYTGADVYANQSWTFPGLLFNSPIAGYSNDPQYDTKNRKYAFDNAGDWTLASPSSSAKKGYSIKEIGAISFNSNGDITSNPNWKSQHVEQYYQKQGWNASKPILNRIK